jgi:hypothetical protein
MSSWQIGVAAALIPALVISTNVADKSRPAGSRAAAWMTDYTQALRAARAQDKPLFVVFRCPH